jgi:DNA helicase IV
VFANTTKGSESGVIIEYFGLKGEAHYDKDIERKKEYWSNKSGWALIEIYPADVKGRNRIEFFSWLIMQLAAHNIQYKQLDEHELWLRLKDRAIGQFTRAVALFVGRCRKRSLSAEDLSNLIQQHRAVNTTEKSFLAAAQQVYTTYLDVLAETGMDDFDGLLHKATKLVESGNTKLDRKHSAGDVAHITHIFIDEFQDFSEIFYQLIQAIRNSGKGAEAFCVGDDWQAINGFAGSNLTYFAQFDDYFESTKHLNLISNFRSGQRIVATGNALMKGLGPAAHAATDRPGRVDSADIESFTPSVAEQSDHSGDIHTPAILRLCNDALKDNFDVVLLFRRNTVPWYVNYPSKVQLHRRGIEGYLQHIRAFLPEDQAKRITCSTVHKYKGLEKAMVIVADPTYRSYPLIHPDWVFTRIFGDTIDKIVDENQRLFYVAVTRAESRLVLLTSENDNSEFHEQIKSRLDGSPNAIMEIHWPSTFAPARDSDRIIVHLNGKTYDNKDAINACGYSYNGMTKTWSKLFSREKWSIEKIETELWVSDADNIGISVEDETGQILNQYIASNGRITRTDTN